MMSHQFVTVPLNALGMEDLRADTEGWGAEFGFFRVVSLWECPNEI